MRGALLSRLDRSLKEGIVTNNGPYVQDFEAVLTKYLRVPTICFSSGQATLTALLMAHDVGGRSVIYPAFTFPATPNAIMAAGGKPVACDIDPETLCIDPNDAARKIVKSTAAILAVDVYGMSSVSPALLDLSVKWDIPLLVDAAPSFGTHVMTKPNAFLAPSIYSFHATKQMAVGEGGCLSSINTDLIKRCKRIRNFGLEDGEWVEPGINGKMTEISALIGLENMKMFPERVMKRRIIKDKLDDALSQVDSIRIIPEPNGQMVSWLYCPVLIEDSAAHHRDILVKHLAEWNIHTRTYYGVCGKKTFNPISNNISGRVIALPCHEYLDDDDIYNITRAFVDVLGWRKA
jgi:dTDP-4-amino-4,6-dideoxy-D-glucose transaminase